MVFQAQRSAARHLVQMCAFPYRAYLRRHRCIFIHIPKTAGTSVLQALGENSSGRDHLPWYVYYSANPKRFQQYYKFSFVRNPWDRAYSAYRYLSGGGNQQDDLAIQALINEFDSYDHFLVDGLGQGLLRSHALFLPQSNFIVGRAEKIMVDFVGRYETLVEDYKTIAKRLELSTTLPRANQSAGMRPLSYRKAYQSQEAVAVIANLYSQDIHTFGYRFAEESGVRP